MYMTIARSTNHAGRDLSAQISTSVMITRKDAVPLNVFYDYWGDVHGVLAARGEGVAYYWQHRFGAALPDFFRLPSSVDQAVPSGDPIAGMAEITFESPEDRGALIGSAVAGEMVLDEQNVLKGTYMYSTGPGNAITLLDRFESNSPQGVPDGYSVMTFIRQAEDVSVGQFRSFVSEFARQLKETQGVMKVRFHLLEAYDSAAWPTPHVDHERAADQQYQAYIELALDTQADALSPAFDRTISALTNGIQENVSALTTYPSFQKNTMRYAGRPTVAGLRGLSAMRTLAAVGDPANEKALSMLRLIFGEAVLEPAA
jgi:hypothetical protein